MENTTKLYHAGAEIYGFYIKMALYQTTTANTTNQSKKQIFTVVWVM